MLVLRFATLTGLATAASIPRPRDTAGCENPVKRLEWREMSAESQQSYINAVWCLKTKPSKLGLNSTWYDDFAYVHHKYNLIIHNVAAFLPWHRYFTQVYENALHECGYNGAATYWDWTKDVQKLAQSPIMSSTLGIGGDGSDSRTETLRSGQTIRCVDDGPFSQLRPTYLGVNPSEYTYEEHCLFRSLIDGDTPDAKVAATAYNSTFVNQVQSSSSFDTYHGSLEGGPHGIIHSSIGGEMNPSTSPNDPVFFLHHAQIDRLWWLWQQSDVAARQADYTGQAAVQGSDTRVAASLDDALLMGGLAEDATVRDLMTTTSSRLCYEY
ncbi:monooxygenase [Colletotrichum truncatum]|uniref:Monooxygenase n=1 Tax=Colletotrichum truncatum TaxID=5467 RepID=A0ACC3YNG7_COLTU|nr:monooxygenase [Colletotrichum truncatum]KAF6789464.1 monooxygenase [Colletotrichum truncatum]